MSDAAAVPQPFLRGSVHPPLSRRTPFRPEDWFSPDELAEARRYAKPVNKLRLVRTILSTVVIAALLLSKAVPNLLDDLGVDGWALQVFIAIFAMNLLDALATAWVTGYLQLSYDKKWGLSNQTPGRFVADQFKDLGVSTLLLAALLIPVYAAIRSTDLWWLWGWVGFMGVQVLAAFVYPVLIMPRFNKFTPLPEGDLRTAIEGVARLAETEIEGVYTMDASKRSSRGNAFVAGFGATKRVVLFDTILDYPIATIEQIVAHEIGHYRLKHITKSVPFAGALFLVAFGVVAFAGTSEWVLDLAGVDRLGDPGSVPLFFVLFGLAWTGLNLAQAWYSRFKEREADLEALELLGSPSDFIDVWRRMAPDNKMELEPSKWTQLNASHPDVAERMAFGQAWAEANSIRR